MPIAIAPLAEQYALWFKTFQRHAQVAYRTHGYNTGEPNQTAASFKSILQFISQVKNPDSMILDAGAGATTFVFRKFFKNVVTVDHDYKYLGVVHNLCLHHGLNHTKFTSSLASCPPVDYVYYDFGEPQSQQRLDNLLIASDLARSGMYIANVSNNPEYRKHVKRLLFPLIEKGMILAMYFPDDDPGVWVDFEPFHPPQALSCVAAARGRQLVSGLL